MTDDPYIYCGAINGVLMLLENNWKIPRAPLMEAAGLVPEDLLNYDDHIPLEAFAVILEEAARITQNPFLTFELVETFEKYANGLIHYAFRKSPSVREALSVGARYAGIMISFRSIEFTELKGFGYFKWNYRKGFDGMQQMPVWAPARVVVMLRGALGQDWKPEEVCMEQGAPENLDAYHKMFGSNISFSQPENTIRIASADLDRKMPSGDQHLWKYLIDLSDKLMEEQATRPAIISDIQKHIIDALPGDTANIKDISKLLGKSPRTLQRELQSVGANFSQILDQTRQDLAGKYLLDTDLHISQIAFLLGFAEVSVFTRAVKRWFGHSPSAYRQQNQQEKIRKLP
ncbi:MAG: AraC family transcriptional regulator [Methyloligellaceae bacterium]